MFYAGTNLGKTALIACVCVAIAMPCGLFSQQTEMISVANNYTTFTQSEVVVDKELIDAVPEDFVSHPDFGKLPVKAPCEDCYELIHKRTEKTRFFATRESKGHEVYSQQSYGAFNFKDAQGRWLAMDSRLGTVVGSEGLFKSRAMPVDAVIDRPNELVKLEDGENSVQLNHNLKLFVVSGAQKTLIATGDWSNATFGDDGMYVKEFFPGIDLEVITGRAAIKTNFIIKQPLNLSGGFLVVEDDFSMSNGIRIDKSGMTQKPNGRWLGVADFVRKSDKSSVFKINQPVVYDHAFKSNSLREIAFDFKGGKYRLYTPLKWINSSERVYPIVIDPLLSASSTWLQGAMPGSGFANAGGFTNACNYIMPVAVPAAVTVTDIIWQFDYNANGGAALCYGGLDFSYGACRSPSVPTQYWFCNNCAFAGTCGSGAGISIYGHLSSCVPAPQCASYNMSFTMAFYDRYNLGVCSNADGWIGNISAASNWTMTVRGRDLETLNNGTTGNGTSTYTGTCMGSSVLDPVPNPSYGVTPYNYTWTPGGQTTSTITVPNWPNGQVYTCTVIDACGTTRLATFNMNCPLPVALLSLDAEVKGDNAVVSWSTQTEVNNDRFVVQRSAEGKVFESIGEVKGAGNSSVLRSYMFTDIDPYEGVSYYRLQQNDFNGEVTYTDLVAVENIKRISMNMQPNPSKGEIDLKIQSHRPARGELMVMDATGRIVHAASWIIRNGITTEHLDLSHLNGGVYFVKLSWGSGVLTQQLVLN